MGQELMSVVVLRARAEPEADQPQVRRSLGVADDRVGTYGGRVVAALDGRSVLAFPDPRAALAFVVAVRPLLRGGQLGAGVSFGDVKGVEELRGDAYDDAQVLADRADPGCILVSDVVRRLAGPVAGSRFVDRGRIRFPGSAERWPVHEVAEAQQQGPVAVFGRDVEQAAIDDLLRRVAAGTGGALVLEGEPGIGKSHLLLYAAARAAAAGIATASGAADELEQDRPGRLLVPLAHQLGHSGAELLGRDADTGSDPAYAVVERFTDVMADLAARQPLLLVADDLQWADPVSLRALASVAARADLIPVAVVASMRPAPRPPALVALLDPPGPRRPSVLRLGGLDDAAVAGVVASVTGAAPGTRLRAQLRATGGNPLFVTEVLAALEETGALRIEGGVTEADPEAAPEGLIELVQRRVERLPGDAPDLLRAASLLGGEFDLDDVAAVGGRRVVDVAAGLRPAVDAALLRGDGARLAFRHDLVREAVHRSIPASMRGDLHVAAGHALAARGAPPDRVARQLALGARPGDANAASWLLRAGREAAATDTATAVRWYEQACAIAPPDWPQRTEVEASLAELLAWSGRVDEATALGQALFDRSLTPVDRLRAHRALASVRSTVGDLRAAGQQLEQAAGLPEVDDRERRVLRCAAAGMAVISGHRPAEHAASVGRAHLDTADPVVACWARNTLAVAAVADGAYDDVAEHARIATTLLEGTHVPPLGFLIPQTWLATALLNLDQLDAARAAARRAYDDGRRRGDVGLVSHAVAALVGIDWSSGAWDDARAHLDDGFELVQDTGVPVHVLLLRAVAAGMALSQGDVEAAEEHLAVGEEFWASGRSHPFGLDVLAWVRGQVLEAAGEHSAAAALLRGVWAQTGALRGLVQWRLIGPDLARLLRGAGHVDEAIAVAADVEAVAARSSSVSARAAAARARGSAVDDSDLALHAVSMLRSTSRALERALACEDAAGLLVAGGQDAAAVAMLDEAAEVYTGAGATGAVNRIDARRRGLGVRRRRAGSSAATHGWEALSPKEGEVVRLVAAGLSNPEIGERLYISRRTVESHLSSVFRKLDLPNRTSLAAAAAARTVA